MKRRILCLMLTLQTLSFSQVEMGQTQNDTRITKISDDLYYINLTHCQDCTTCPTIHMHTGGRIVADSTQADHLSIICSWEVSVSAPYINVIVEKFHIVNDDRVCDTSSPPVFWIRGLSKLERLVYEANECSEPKVVALHSTNRFGFKVTVAPPRRFTSIVMRIVPTEKCALYTYSHTAVNPVMGYVTTFGFDGRTHYSDRSSARYKWILPSGHVVMISFPHFDIEESPQCHLDHMALYHNGIHSAAAQWICGSQDVPPQIHNTSIVLDFYAGDEGSGTGFKLIYTIHNVSDQPQQVMLLTLSVLRNAYSVLPYS
ncbi:hypothetical protein BaRGS_00038990 [Batillaria attramentaria]|uniref:CUB domain-containing protein n=1 Tax=Batillaria attramentaria TaxID=370345 RepID=A0ABD0J4Y0_9CAEN